MFITTKRYVRQKPVHGFVVGDLAYWVDPSRVQYQMRVDDIIKTTGVCRPIMRRHHETINGRESGGYTKWTPHSGARIFNIHLTELKRESHE